MDRYTAGRFVIVANDNHYYGDWHYRLESEIAERLNAIRAELTGNTRVYWEPL